MNPKKILLVLFNDIEKGVLEKIKPYLEKTFRREVDIGERFLFPGKLIIHREDSFTLQNFLMILYHVNQKNTKESSESLM